MKVCLGYYDRDGKPLGKKLDSTRRKSFYLAMGTIRKKIGEHENQSPYSKREIQRWSKTYCDLNRMFVEIHHFEDGLDTGPVKHPDWYDIDRGRYPQLKRITEHLKTHIDPESIRKYRLKYIFHVNGERIDTEEQQRR